VVVIDWNDYHQFQPLLYQVAAAQLGAGGIARSLRGIFAKDHPVSVKTAAVASVDPTTHTDTTADGTRYSGHVLVLAPGAQTNFFHTPGAAKHSFPLYSVAGRCGCVSTPSPCSTR
jgi:NADH dehydrogenase